MQPNEIHHTLNLENFQAVNWEKSEVEIEIHDKEGKEIPLPLCCIDGKMDYKVTVTLLESEAKIIV